MRLSRQELSGQQFLSVKKAIMQRLKVLVLLCFHYSIVKFTSNSYSAYYINNFLTKCVPSCRLLSTLSIGQCFIIYYWNLQLLHVCSC